MSGPPVVITTSLGRPVTNVFSERGAVPMVVVSTLGEPVTLVASGGEPVTLLNPNGTLWDFPFSLFLSGAQGAWYDPSDFSTLFQDSAGSTPVTAVEQPVRLMRDKSGRTNHATAPNDASRPVLRARYNLLTFSEQFDNAAWTKSATGDVPTVTANTTLAPDGTTTADTITNGATPTLETVLQTVTVVSGASVAASIRFKRGNHDWVRITVQDGAATQNGFGAWFDVANGVVGATQTEGTGLPTSKTITALGNGWYACTITGSVPTATTYRFINASANADNSFTRVANGTRIVWGAQLLTAADQTSTGGAYQRIAAATSYDTSNPVFRPYLAFDGSDDMMTIASSIHGVFQNVGGGTMWAGYGGATVVDGNLIAVANNATAARASLVTNLAGGRRLDADTFANATDSGWVAGGTYVATNVSDWAGGNVIRRTNGVQVASAAYSSGAGNTSNTASSAAYLFTNPSALAFALGRLYSAIILGRAATTAELTATEQWINGKTGAY
jgi:hypothetical protein